ncbi:MAG TPA: DUF3667 domain-containing protein [Longimicrobiales bacterium]
MRALLLHPGRLSREYFQGHIQRYIPPFKLYLMISVLFFVLVNVLTMRGLTNDLARQIHTAQDSLRAAQRRDSTIAHRRMIGVTIGGRDTTNWLRDTEFHSGIESVDRMANERMHKLADLGPREGTRRMVRALLDQAPRVLFVLLPVYALLLFAFYWRQRRYYVEHFVFALHVHSFIFLMLIPGLLLDIAWLHTLIFVSILLYVLVAMKRFYEQSYIVVLLKGFVLWLCYWVVFAVGLLGALLLALATI